MSLRDEHLTKFTLIDTLILEKTNVIKYKNRSIIDFFNAHLTYLEMSQTNLSLLFNGFKILVNIETLILRQVNLENMLQINFQTFSSLKYLDLALNRLTHIYIESFLVLNHLEY